MGLVIASLIAATMAILIYGGTLFWLARPGERRLLSLAVVVAVPLTLLAYHLVRTPIEALFGVPGGTLWLRATLPPLIE
jgi:hypothetical protein